jgi:hypothetical protein
MIVPTDAEVDTLIVNTFDFYLEVFLSAYNDTLVDIIPGAVQAGQVESGFNLFFTTDFSFSSAIPSEAVIETIEAANTTVYLSEFVRPSGPYFALTETLAVVPVLGDENGIICVPIQSDPPITAETGFPTTDAPLTDPPLTDLPSVPGTSVPTDAQTEEISFPMTEPPLLPLETEPPTETELPTEAMTDPPLTGAPTQEETVGSTEVLLTNPPLSVTDAPESIPPVTAVPTEEETVGVTDVLTDAPESTPPATAFPTEEETLGSTEALLTNPPLSVTDAPESIPPVTAVPTEEETLGLTDVLTDAPESIPPVTAVPTEEETVGSTEVLLTDPPATVTDAPESVPPVTAVPTEEETVGSTEVLLTDPPATVTDAPESIPPVTAVPTEEVTVGSTEVLLTDPPATVTDAPESIPPVTAVPTEEETVGSTEVLLTDPPATVTDAPVSIPPVTAVPSEEETVGSTEVPLTDPPGNVTVSPTDVPSSGETVNQTGECPTLVSQNGNMTYFFFFADREPTVEEARLLEDATYRFFTDTFAAAFNDTFVSFSGEETSSEFSFDGLLYRLGFTGLSLFSPCAPSLAEFDAAIAGANYDTMVLDYVRTEAAAIPMSVLVFIDRAEYNGTSKYS